MNSFKQQCIALRKQDLSLGEIAKITGRPKSSVYVHIHHVPLSEQKRRYIRAARGARALEIAAGRKGSSVRAFRTFDAWDRDMVALISHLLFDGEIKHAGCYYHNRSAALLDKVEQCMKSMYDFEPRRYKNHRTGVGRICFFNVALAAYIKRRSEELLENITNMPRNLKMEFLKSFFDDEGCMDYRPRRNHRRVRGYQKNVKILYLIKKLLADFDIESEIKKPNEVVIRGRENLRRFQGQIGFSPGVKINGNRSNSIWKESLEKRELLKKAIASYKPIGSNGVHRGVPSNHSHGREISMTGSRLE